MDDQPELPKKLEFEKCYHLNHRIGYNSESSKFFVEHHDEYREFDRYYQAKHEFDNMKRKGQRHK